jgi:hypothetical protein
MVLFLEDFIKECESTKDRSIAVNNEMLRFTKPTGNDDTPKKDDSCAMLT